MKIVKEMTTETAHRLTDYPGKCAHIHGHSYRWRVVCEGEPDRTGIVLDFSIVKEVMQSVIGRYDHALLLHDRDPLAKNLDALVATNGEQGRVILFPFNPTAENMAGYVLERMQKSLPVPVVSVECWETATCGAMTC